MAGEPKAFPFGKVAFAKQMTDEVSGWLRAFIITEARSAVIGYGDLPIPSQRQSRDSFPKGEAFWRRFILKLMTLP